MRVAVIGGGIGGLFAANALLRRGIQVSVHEQAPALGEIGAGVLITPNSFRQLERLGLGDAVADRGVRIGDGSQYHRHDGTVVAPIVTTDSSGWNAVFGMHRADLVDVLAAPLAGIVHTGRRAVAFEDEARVVFDDGTAVEADAVIAADGLHSALQRFVAAPPAPVSSGSVAYRGLVPFERVPWWPARTFQMWMGRGKHFLVFPVRGGELVNYVGFVPTDERMRESWSAPGDPDELRAEFAGWDERIEGLLAHVEHTFRWGLYDREPLPRWTRGRLALLGDAAHPMLPHLGQGANQAIEDGMALAALLDGVTAGGVPDALAGYEALRRPRTADVQRGSRANQLRYDSAYEDLAIRDAEIAASKTLRAWIYDHDVLATLEREEARR